VVASLFFARYEDFIMAGSATATAVFPQYDGIYSVIILETAPTKFSLVF
jgi:hypothetical protein